MKYRGKEKEDKRFVVEDKEMRGTYKGPKNKRK